jgi:hypothetical protein
MLLLRIASVILINWVLPMGEDCICRWKEKQLMQS